MTADTDTDQQPTPTRKLTGKERWQQREVELEKLAKARPLWTESEWVLEILRSRSAKSTSEPEEAKLLEWHARLTGPLNNQYPT